MASTGTILQVIGSTFDAQFPESDLPEIYNAIDVELEAGGQKIRLVGEVAKHLGGGTVRCVALGSTDGMRRGQPCVDTGSPVTVPVGGARSIVIPRPSSTSTRRPKSFRPASRSSTFSAPSSAVARSASSVVRASARPWSSRR
jgi:hypothetical protein